MNNNEFYKFARMGRGISSTTLHRYESALDSYINPTIIEERKLNVASMDVFSRLMMDRVIFLGVPIDDDVANIIMAQLLFLASTDSMADISLYLNTPGGQVSSGLAIYDTMQIIEPDVATICTGMAASMGSVLLCAGTEGKRSALPHSRVLIHQPLGGAQGQASDIIIAAKGEYLRYAIHYFLERRALEASYSATDDHTEEERLAKQAELVCNMDSHMAKGN